MRIYAASPTRRLTQVVGDLVVLGWVVVWAVLASVLHAAVAALAGPVDDSAGTIGRLRDDLRQAAEQAGTVPGVGGSLRQPFDSAVGTLAGLQESVTNQSEDLQRLAILLGVAAFVLPVSIVVGLWLPRRLRFVRTAREAERYLAGGAGPELFALRALANQPLPVLISISDDPVADWRAGNQDVVNALAAAELRRLGLPGRGA